MMMPNLGLSPKILQAIEEKVTKNPPFKKVNPGDLGRDLVGSAQTELERPLPALPLSVGNHGKVGFGPRSNPRARHSN